MKLNKNHFLFTSAGAIITLLVGILLTAQPWILEKICLYTGAVLCMAGLILIVIYFIRKQENSTFLSYGLAALIPGILLSIIPSVLKFLIPVLFGLWILVSAGSGAFRNYTFRKSYPFWWVGLILCLVGVCIGLYVITRPVDTMQTTIRLIGIAMIIHAALRLVSAFMGRKCYAASDVIETTIED